MKKQVKKAIISALLSMSLLFALIPSVYAKTHEPYAGIEAVDYDATDLRTAQGKSTFKATSTNIGAGFYATDAVIYKNVNFDVAPARVKLYSGVPERYAGIVEMHLDSYNGPLIASLKIKPTDWDVVVENNAWVETNFTGTHDIYLVLAKGMCNVFNFIFISGEDVRKEYSIYDGGKYSDITDSDEKYYCELMSGFNIFGDISDNNFQPDFPVKRGDFVSSLATLLNIDASSAANMIFTDVSKTDKNYNAIAMFNAAEIINGCDKTLFMPDEFITYDEAASICARALYFYSGKDAAITTSMLLQKKNKILIGVGENSADGVLKRGQQAKLLYNFVTCEYTTIDSVSNDSVKYDMQKYILEESRDVYLAEGVVDGNQVTMLSDPSSEIKDRVSLDGTVYFSNNSGAEKFIGLKCKFFYEKSSSDDILKIISITQSKRTQETKITDEHNPYMSGTKLVYEINNKQKEAVIPNTAKIIYNGKPYEDADLSLLTQMQNCVYSNNCWKKDSGKNKEFRGEIRLVSYDGGDGYDVVFVDYYQNIVFGGFDDYNHLLIDRLSDDTFYINDTDSLSYGNIFLDGKLSDPSMIPDLCGGYVYKSLNNEGVVVVKAYFFTDSISGTVNEMSDEDIIIDDSTYKIALEYETAMKTIASVQEIEIGKAGDFSLNPFGEIVWFTSGDLIYIKTGAYVVYDVSSGVSDKVQIKIQDYDNGTLIYYTASKVEIDGVARKTCDDIVEGVIAYENSGLANLKKGSLIRYIINANNEITMIDTPATLLGGSNDCLSLLSNSISGESLLFKSAPCIFGNATEGNKYPARNTAVLFKQPLIGTTMFDEGDSFVNTGTITTLGSTDKYHLVALYSIHEDSKIADVVVKFDQAGDYGNDIYIYTGCSNILDRNSETAYSINLNSSGKVKKYIVSQSCSDELNVTSLIKGSLLRLSFDSYGEVSGILVVYTPYGSSSGSISETVFESGSTMQSDLRYVYGTVKEREDQFVKISLGNAIRDEFINISSASVSVCEYINSQLNVSSVNGNSLQKGDKAVVIMSYGSVKLIVVYK